jgi:hypothetical protein
METKTFTDLLNLKPGQTKNLKHLILEAFIDGERLTTVTTLQKYGTLELQVYVSKLRALGVPIADEWAVNPSTGKRYKKYWLAA